MQRMLKSAPLILTLNCDKSNVHWIFVNLIYLLLCCELTQPIGNI